MAPQMRDISERANGIVRRSYDLADFEFRDGGETGFTFEGVASGNSSYLSTSTGIPGTNLAADGRPGYPNRKALNILRRGQIYVFTTEAVALNSPVRFWDTDHSGTVAASNGNVVFKQASGSAGDLKFSPYLMPLGLAR